MTNLYEKLLRKLAHFQVEHPFITIFLLLLLTIAIYGGVSSVKTVASLEQMMPTDIEEIAAFHELRDNNLGQEMIAIVLSLDRESTDPNAIMDIRDPRVTEHVRYIKSVIAQELDVLTVYGVSDFVPEDYTEETYTASLKDQQASRFINDDYTKTIIIATTDVSAADARMKLLSEKIKQDINSIGTLPGIKIQYTGTPIIQQKLGELITHDRANTQWISTIAVFLVTALLFGTFSSAVVPILIVTISVNWLYGTMGYTNLPISTLAGGVAAMVIGIGIDFAIHILNKFKFERKKGHSIKQSIELAVLETGVALTATSLTTTAAFLAFLSGQMPEMGRFGILMAIGIGYSLVFSLFGLPALLVIEEKIITFIRKKAHFGVEGELHLEANKK